MLLTTLLSLITAGTVLGASEWPIPIPPSLLPEHPDQRVLGTYQPRPENVRLIQTVEGRYQWTGDVEQLLRDGIKLMDVLVLKSGVLIPQGNRSLASRRE
jgi:hypothetical protein